MTMQRIVLLNLALLVVLAAGGYVRSRAALGGESGQMLSASSGESGAPAVEPTPAPLLPAAPEGEESGSEETGIEGTGREVTGGEVTGSKESLAAQAAHDGSRPALGLAAAAAATEALLPLDRTVNILLLGSDRRPDQYDWRTDVLMILALDVESGQAGAISFPRDIFLEEIPGHRPNKINVVDFLGEQDEKGGGPELLASILTEKTGVPIHHFLRFDFESFKAAVDALDGVALTVECRAWEYLPEEDITLLLEPGTHRLDGRTALGYVRARNQGGDLERARRQQRLVLAVRDQLLHENQLPNLPALYGALLGAVQTDLGFIDAIRLARFGLALTPESIHGVVLSPPELMTPGWRQGMSVFVADWPAIGERMQTVFSRPPLQETNTIGATGDRVECP